MVGRFGAYRLFLDPGSFIYPTELDSEKERFKFNGSDYAYELSRMICSGFKSMCLSDKLCKLTASPRRS